MPALFCVIFDLDGTLSDCRWRRHLVECEKKDFAKFHAAAHQDPPNVAVAWLFKSIRNTRTLVGSPPPWLDQSAAMPVPIICTGRPEEHRKSTEAWLFYHGLHAHALHMRSTGDFRPDTVVKLEMLNKIRGQGFNVLFTVDDRDSVVKMWREQGLTCMQVAEGDF